VEGGEVAVVYGGNGNHDGRAGNGKDNLALGVIFKGGRTGDGAADGKDAVCG
jgi:hypothetical protein